MAARTRKTPPTRPTPTDPVEIKLRAAVSEFLGRSEDEITLDSRFADDLGADSLDCIEIVMLAEERFHVAIEDDETDTVQTFGALVALVRAKQAAA